MLSLLSAMPESALMHYIARAQAKRQPVIGTARTPESFTQTGLAGPKAGLFVSVFYWTRPSRGPQVR